MKLIINNTHRPMIADEYAAEHAQAEESKPVRFYTGDELLFACFLSCFAGMMVTVGLAFVWSFFL